MLPNFLGASFGRNRAFSGAGADIGGRLSPFRPAVLDSSKFALPLRHSCKEILTGCSGRHFRVSMSVFRPVDSDSSMKIGRFIVDARRFPKLKFDTGGEIAILDTSPRSGPPAPDTASRLPVKLLAPSCVIDSCLTFPTNFGLSDLWTFFSVSSIGDFRGR